MNSYILSHSWIKKDTFHFNRLRVSTHQLSFILKLSRIIYNTNKLIVIIINIIINYFIFYTNKFNVKYIYKENFLINK